MSVKLAFSTVTCPDWTLAKVAEQAEALGFDGVELRTLGAGESDLACDPALTDPQKVSDIFRSSGMEPICLSTSTSLHHRNKSAATAAHRQVIKDLDLASLIGCSFVRIFVYDAGPGEDRRSVIQRAAKSALPLAERAGELGVQLLFENAGSFTAAKHWWWLLNQVDHPMLGLLWNVANAAASGESSAVSVPTLNSRIQMAKVKDTMVGEGSGFVPLGEGTVGIEAFIKQLLGVGYSGYLTVEWDRVWLPSLTPAEEYLPQALERIKGWLEDIQKSEEKGVEVAEKAAKRNAPKPRPKYVPA